MQGGAANEEGAMDCAVSKYKKILAADRTLLGTSSRRGFSGKEAAELNERGSSRRLMDHRACVGTCPYISYADYHHPPPQPAIPSSGSTSHWNAHRMKPAYQMGEGEQAATSAPACKIAWPTWHGSNSVTCQATHTFHHHHYHFWEWRGGMERRIGSSHGCSGTDSCCEIKAPHDLGSHEGPAKRANECPVKKPKPSPVTRGPSRPVTSRQSKRFVENEDEDLYAASSLTVFKVKSSLQLNTPPLPSPTHGLPLVLCQHCSRLLLLPPSGTLLLPSVTPLLHHLLYVRLKCGFCLNTSKFSTRHLNRPPPTAGTGSPSPLPPVREPVEITSMPSCSTSNGTMQEAPDLKRVETEVPLNDISEEFNNGTLKFPVDGNGKLIQEYKNHEAGEHFNGVCAHPSNQEGIEAGEPLHGICGYSQLLNNSNGEHTQEYGKLKTGEYFNGVCEYALKQEHTEAGEALKGVCEGSSQLKHVETGVLGIGKCGHTSQSNDVETGVSFNGVPERSLEQTNIRTEAGHTSDVETGEFLNGMPECSSEQNIIKTESHSNGAPVPFGVSQLDWQPEREQEITAFSSVQDWVDSLTVESGYESDSQLQGPSNSHRPPLHQHFGYNSPSELFEKVFTSEDEETKTRTDSNSVASSSSSPINACQQSEIKISSMHAHNVSLRSWNTANTNPSNSSLANGIISPKHEEQDAQRSLAGFVKRGLMQKGRLLPARPKTRVVVNGHVLSSAAVKQAEERAGKLRTGSYWYDCKAGFWGVEGGPCLGILPPFIEELDYSMLKNCSNGDTQVYINGRELHIKDLAVLSQRGLSQKAGRAYALGFDGVLVDETTGLELKRLGKLAPTVERRGKGFGMFTAQVLK